MSIDRATRKILYNLCSPDEPLAPEDARNVDIDALPGDARGDRWVEKLAARIELSTRPVCEFFTGLPGSGVTTELLRLGARLSSRQGGNFLVVHIAAEEVLDLTSPLHEADLLLAILLKTFAALHEADGKPLAPRWRRLRDGEPAARAAFLAEFEVNTSRFITEARDDLVLRNHEARQRGQEGLVILVDGLEKLRGLSSNWSDVLASAERLFSGGSWLSQLPVHVVCTLPPALTLRMTTPVTFLPMLRVCDRQGVVDAGFQAALEIIRRRVRDPQLGDILGSSTWESRLGRIIVFSGGSPRELIRILQAFIAEGSIDEATFDRQLRFVAEQYHRSIPENALPWLLRIHQEKRLVVEDESSRYIAEQMMQAGVVMRYQNGEPWADLHPAVADWSPLRNARRMVRWA